MDRKDLIVINGQMIAMLETVHKMINAVVNEDPNKGSITSFQRIKLESQTEGLLEYIHKVATKEVNEK